MAQANESAPRRVAPILHITTIDGWGQAQRHGFYETASLHLEDFIHCSMPEQVVEVANRVFPGRTDLILLVIDPERLDEELRHEKAENGQIYPHIYGAINLGAVLRVKRWVPTDGGVFEFPANLLPEER